MTSSSRHHTVWMEDEGAVFAADFTAPPDLLDVLSCGCKAEGKACSSTACSFQKNQPSCTRGSEGCHNPFLFTASSQVDETDYSVIILTISKATISSI